MAQLRENEQKKNTRRKEMFPSTANWGNSSSWKLARYNSADIETRPAGRYKTERGTQDVPYAKRTIRRRRQETRINTEIMRTRAQKK